MTMRNLSNTELRLWQQQLLDNISSPSDREVIWVIGQKNPKENMVPGILRIILWIRKSGAT